MVSLAGRAYAKINLGLRILGPRADGYHELRTVFQTISLADRLKVGYQPGGERRIHLLCSGAELPGPENLASQAAGRLLEAGGWGGQVSIELEKQIPSGAGLGGGSSDAGAVLVALSRVLRPPADAALLIRVAAELGSDVPFFLLGGTAAGAGRGEEVYPLPEVPRCWLLILAPPLPSPTAEAYRALRQARGRLTEGQKRNMMEGFCAAIRAPSQGGAPNLAEALGNDFEDVIFRKFPELEQWKQRLRAMGASSAQLSGSGSALFGMFEDRATARRAHGEIADFPGKAWVVRTVNRREYHAGWELDASQKTSRPRV